MYGIAHDLYSVKDNLENYLSKRSNELFDLEDKIIIYDLTNTYFEGRMLGNKIAKFGNSKEKRNDARLIHEYQNSTIVEHLTDEFSQVADNNGFVQKAFYAHGF